jgi:hypothetical protein
MPSFEDQIAKREKRARRRLTVALLAPGQGQVAGYTSNLAVHGLSVGCNRVFEKGTALKVIVTLADGDRVTLDGEITWSRAGFRGGIGAMGVKLSKENPQYTAFLKRFHPELFR